MRFLLDTHIFLFMIKGENAISAETIEIINSTQHQKFFSIASIWEIAIKISIGKLKIIVDAVYSLLDEYGIEIIMPNQKHLKTYLTLPFLHKDPFDRLIISQALAENLTLITDDQQITHYPNLKLLNT